MQDIPIDGDTNTNPVTISTITASNSTNKDYLQHWKLFIFGFIAQQISLGHQIYRSSVELDNFLEHFKNKGKSRSFRVSGGSASFDISANPKAALQLDFTSENEDQVPTSLLLAKMEEQFRRLVPLRKKLNIYFDELELTVLDSSRRARDALLVRDLIRATEQINRLTTELQHGVHITLAIRSDVANIASQTGFEINKIIQDFGLKMNWSPSLPKVGLHPLAMILARRLQAATDGNIDPNSYHRTWNQFFPRTIHGVPSQTFYLHQTWFKPRDIIRLRMVCTTTVDAAVVG